MHNAVSTNTTSDAKNEFRVIETIADPDGIVAVITERIRDGRVSFMIAREFEQNGETKRSAYLARRHIAAVRRLIADLEERLELAEDRARAALRSKDR